MAKSVEQARRELFEQQMDALDKNPGQWLGSSYSNAYGEAAWIGFNAALDAVVILAPSESENNRPYNQGLYDYRAAIESTGLGIKTK